MRVPLTLACGDYDRTHPLASGAEQRRGLIKEPRSPASLFAAGTREAFVI